MCLKTVSSVSLFISNQLWSADAHQMFVYFTKAWYDIVVGFSPVYEMVQELLRNNVTFL